MKQNVQLKKYLFVIMMLLFAFSSTVHAAERWLVLGNTGWVSGDSGLTLEMTMASHPDLIVTSNTVSDLEWINMQIPFFLGGVIKRIYLCYKSPNEGSHISQIRLSEYLLPGAVNVKHEDSTELISQTGDCYQSFVNNYMPQGSVNLSLRLNFANEGDTIQIGALGILIDD